MAYLLLGILLIPATIFISLQSNKVQTYASKKGMEILSENLDAKFSLDKIELKFFNRIAIRNLYIEDQEGDTLLYTGKLTASIAKINLKQRKILLQNVHFENAFINLYQDSLYNINLKFLIKKKTKTSPASEPWDLDFKNIELENSRFAYSAFVEKDSIEGINFTALRINNMNLNVKRFKPKGDTINFIIKSLTCTEESGFNLTGFNSRTSICNNHLTFEDILIQTPYSSLKGNRVNLYFKDFSAFKASKLYGAVKLDISLNESSINLFDLSYFVPSFSGSKQSFTISGDVSGPLSNISGNNINIKFGNSSVFSGNIDLDGLPDVKETFIYAKLKNVESNYDDLLTLNLPLEKKIKIPEIIKKMGNISYKGRFTGFIKDFVAYGTIRSDLGIIKTDLLLKPDATNSITFSGNLITEDYYLGKLLDNEEEFGKITMNISANGNSSHGKSIYAKVSGTVSNLEYKQYPYKNITLSGILQENKYDGEIAVNDPNLDFGFHGLIDFSEDPARYIFNASVTNANLYALNIDKSDPSQTVAFDIKANVKGDNINELNGEINLVNSLFTKKDNQIQIYDIDIDITETPGEKLIALRSDFADADIKGDFYIDQIGKSLNKFIYLYLPALIDSAKIIDTLDFKHRFEFYVNIKNAKPISDYFFPDYFIGENTKIEGSYIPESKQMNIILQSPVIEAKGIKWENLFINLQSDQDHLSISSGSENLKIKDKINLENFTINSITKSDSINLSLSWNNWDSSLYRGSIKTLLHLEPDDLSRAPKIIADIIPTTITTYDSVWNIKQCRIAIKNKEIEFNNLEIEHAGQFMKVFGKISENPLEKLYTEFHDFNISNLNTFFESSGIDIKGSLNGNAELSNLYTNPYFFSKIAIDSLIINNEKLGNLEVNSTWDNIEKSIFLEVSASRGNLKTLTANGFYSPGNKGIIDFDVKLNKLRLNVFEPYTNKIVSDLKGLASGSIKVKGTLARPLFNGEILLQKSTFTVNYLKTQYYFTHNIEIKDNNIYLANIDIIDQFGNKAVLNGTVTNTYFRNFRLNLNINARNFQFLNTDQNDNNQFYGTAFASGIVHISGSPKNINMDISARTDRNTRIFIPLSGREAITEYNFVAFSIPGQEENEENLNGKYKVNLNGIEMNFDLEVTPDAEVQMIFDPKVGDILKGKGYGNLKMQINTLGKFTMLGNYIIDEGEYLFTLQNVINRKFSIDNGGSITWNGSPLNAEINLVALYRTKASLDDLLGTGEVYQTQGSGSETTGSESGNKSGIKSKTTVDCQIKMTGKLMNPTIKYDIYLPLADDATRERLKKEISNSDELNKQFLALLVLNNFIPLAQPGSGQASSSPYSGAAGANASEFLSNQLSNWLSQINNNVDVGVNYRSDRKMKRDEVELALSTQLLNDKLTIYGNLDVPTNATANSSNNIVGDVDLDYKITKSGKIRLKAFNHSNEELNILSPYTQGVGFVYKEEFNTFSDLWNRYFVPAKNDEKKKKKAPHKQNPAN